MRQLVIRLGVLVCMSAGLAGATAAEPSDRDDRGRPLVVLLHGLARSDSSMDDMAQALDEAGYRVCNVDYPSRKHPIEQLASRFVAPAIARCVTDANEPVNFVTHSLGGIVVRELARAKLINTFGRVVMLGPPNQGSEVVDALGDWRLFGAINGPAGAELSTSLDSVPRQLGPATFELGVIAGNRSINWINSFAFISGSDDGKVSISSAKLEGMRDFIVLPVSHPFLMTDPDVIKQTIRFLRVGCFLPKQNRPLQQAEPKCVAQP